MSNERLIDAVEDFLYFVIAEIASSTAIRLNQPRVQVRMALRLGPIFLLLLAFTASLRGQEDPRRAQIAAAASQAADALHAQIVAIPLGNDFTAANLIDRAFGQDLMDKLMPKAEQVGGARWLDSQTVEVRMELSGDAVAATLQKIAERHTNVLPMPLHKLREKLKRDIVHHTFAATGASTAGAAVDRLRPDLSQTAWKNIGDADRRSVIDAARISASARVLDSLRGVEWDDGKKRLADAISTRAASVALNQWLASRPITQIEFRDDLEVRITLAVSFGDLWPMLQPIVARSPQAPAPNDDREWNDLRQAAEQHLQPANGQAVLRSAPPPPATVALPADPPAWTLQSLAADAVAGAVGDSKLKTARVAEDAAVQSLGTRINSLPLFANLSIGAAASKDSHIAAAVARALNQSKIARVEYDTPAPGAVRVRMTLDLQILWRELTR